MPSMIKKSNFDKINTVLHKIGTVYHDAIPMDTIFNVVKEQGLVPLQEDNTEWDGFLCGASGQCYIPVGDAATKTRDRGLNFYEPYRKRAIALSWYKMTSGRYEIVAYI